MCSNPLTRRAPSISIPSASREGTVELACGDALVQVDGAVLLRLPASDVQLVALDGDVEIVLIEPGHGRG